MPDYKKMYFKLAGRVADAVEFLIEAQQEGEDAFTKTGSTAIHLSDMQIETNDEKTPANP